MNLLDKHAISIQVFTIIFGLLIFALVGTIASNNFSNLACFLLIITFGISHGALDNLKGRKILNKFGHNNIIIFYFSYLLITFLIIFLWILFSTISLTIFLIVACYHFGKEDTEFLLAYDNKWKNFKNLNNFVYLAKGLLIIFAPLYFHNEETIAIFKILGAENNFLTKFQDDLMWEYHKMIGWISLVGYLIFFYMNFKDLGYKVIHSFDFIPIIVLNFILSPLLAFTFYFCFIHSFKHSISLINFLDNKSFKNGFKLFVKKSLPLTLITAISFIFGVYLLTNFYVLNDAILKVIFIGLASLTFPHILLEYLIEKNEE